MRALVTGATGKVGHAIASALLDRGDRVRALVRDPKRAAGVLPAGIEPIRGDVTDPESLAAAAEGCELVFNSMGMPEQWVKDEAIFDQVNAIGSGQVAIAAKRPTQQQHFCADRGYDYSDVHTFVLGAGYTPHIKHRRRRGEAAAPPGDVPGEASFPARRWVVERTFNWLLKRRSLRTRWCKKAGNWLALVQLACAHILCDMAIYG